MASALAMKEAGFDSLILAHKDFVPVRSANTSVPIIPYFSKAWTEGPRKDLLPFVLMPKSIAARMRPWILRAGQDESFLSRMLEAVEVHGLASHDHMFIHTLGVWQIIEVMVALQLASPSTMPQLNVVLRLDPFEAGTRGAKVELFRLIFEQYQRLIQGGAQIRFYADTPQLATAYESLSPFAFNVLPILFDSKDLIPKNHDPYAPFTVTYLGDSRSEKGFQHLPGIVQSVLGQTSMGEFQFDLQIQLQPHFSHFEILDQARKELLEMQDPRVQLHQGALSPEDYTQLLLAADLVLIPYETEPYERRSSGILSQAIAAGKLAIAPRDTWMGQTIREYDCGYTFRSISEIPRFIIEAGAKRKGAAIEKSQQQADRSRAQWLNVHSSKSFAQMILQGTQQAGPASLDDY